MANGWNSGQQREAMLRRVAIVLSSLPAPVASQLLSAVDPESTKAVRRTMTSLKDVDPLERKRALQAFKMSVEQQPGLSPGGNRSADSEEDAAGGDGAGSRGEPTSRIVSSSIPTTRSTQAELSPLSFLDAVDDDALVRLLSDEHPQAIALVLASISPAHAARVLPQLDPRIRNDALSRVGRLGEVPQDAAAEVARHFRSSLAQQDSVRKSASGQRTLDAILAAMPAPISDHGLASAQHPPEESEPGTRHPADSLSETAAVDLTHRLRVAQHTWPSAEANSRDQPETPVATSPDHPPAGRWPSGTDRGQISRADRFANESSNRRQPSSTDPPQVLATEHSGSDPPEDDSRHALGFASTDAIHQHLLSLAPEQLCRALGKVETRIAMLALCGLPNQVTESILAVLPRAHAKKVRIKMNSLDSLHLREIDEAKEKVAQASLETSGQTLHQVPVAA